MNLRFDINWALDNHIRRHMATCLIESPEYGTTGRQVALWVRWRAIIDPEGGDRRAPGCGLPV